MRGFGAGWCVGVVMSLVCAGTCALPSGAVAGPGALDTTFGPNGTGTVAITDPGTQAQIAGSGLVVDSSGRLVIEGQTQANNLTVTRLLSNGSADSSFCALTCTGPGTETITGDSLVPGNGQTYSGASIALQGDGMILAAGGIKNPSNGPFDMAVERINPADGSRDANFGNGGTAFYSPCADNASAASVLEDTVDQVDKNSIVLAGNAQCVLDSNSQLLIARLSSDGKSVKASYLNHNQSANSAAYDAAIDPTNDDVVVVGFDQSGCTASGSNCLVVERFTPQLSLISKVFPFGGGEASQGYNVAVTSTGVVVASGWCQPGNSKELCAAELNPQGQVIQTLFAPDNGAASQAMALQADGSWVFASFDPTVARAVPDLSGLDQGFGTQGIVQGLPSGAYPPNFSCAAANGVAVDDSGKRIYISGTWGTGGPLYCFSQPYLPYEELAAAYVEH
jgi:uncharacterized delta-60 repeat protein